MPSDSWITGWLRLGLEDTYLKLPNSLGHAAEIRSMAHGELHHCPELSAYESFSPKGLPPADWCFIAAAIVALHFLDILFLYTYGFYLTVEILFRKPR